MNTPHPPAEQQAVSSAVLNAIREANMQLVRTGDDAFMLVPYKVATAEQAAPKAAPAPLSDDAKDAARYRWLRSYNTAKHPEVTEAFFLGDQNMDAAIDAALAAQGGK